MRAKLVLLAVTLSGSVAWAQSSPARPFGTLREQADRQQRWLEQRLTTVLPALMRKHGVDMWVIPMREYNEDPVFSSLVSPTTFAARRRTIYVFFDKCAASGGAAPSASLIPSSSPALSPSANANVREMFTPMTFGLRCSMTSLRTSHC